MKTSGSLFRQPECRGRPNMKEHTSENKGQAQKIIARIIWTQFEERP